MNDYQLKGTITIHQPLFLPWLPMIARIASSEVFVPLDNVQFRPKYLQNRTQYVILKGNGKNEQKWLSLNTCATDHNIFAEAKVRNKEVYDKLIQTIEFNYKHTAYFVEIWPNIKRTIYEQQKKEATIFTINIELLKCVFALLNVKFPTVIYASTLYNGDDRNERIVTICNKLQKAFNLYGIGKSLEVHDVDYLKRSGVHLIGLDREKLSIEIPYIFRRDHVFILHSLFIKGPEVVNHYIKLVGDMYADEINREKNRV